MLKVWRTADQIELFESEDGDWWDEYQEEADSLANSLHPGDLGGAFSPN
mgnify:CR=1 FL=1